MSNTEVVKVHGGPGCGKTTTLVGNTDIDDFKGIIQRRFEEEPVNETMLIAYTRAAADEAKGRLSQLTDITKATLDNRITTIHSLAMSFQSLRPDNIVEIREHNYGKPNDYQNFCNQKGLDYHTGGDDDDDIMAADGDEGHVFFRINSWLKSNMMNATEWEQCPVAGDWPHGDDFVDYALDWIQYKNQRGIHEFDDAIQMCVEQGRTVDSSHLFVDELQDLYPLQQAFLDNHFGEVDRIWVAGDADQTIYEWSGANPEYFLNLEAKVDELDEKYWDDKAGYWDDEGVYILDQSWRMPNEVLKLAKSCISRVGERQDKELKPHHDGGEIHAYRFPSPSDIIDHINHDDTFILFRANYQANEFGKELIWNGIPFEDRFRTWREEVVQLRDGLAAVKHNDPEVDGSDAARVIRELPNHQLNQPNERDSTARSFSARDTVDTQELVDATRLSMPGSDAQFRSWLTEFENRNYYQKEAVHNNLRYDNEHLDPEGVTLETIHWSKGREADTVILSLNTTGTVMENMIGGGLNDAERRLYFVGMTRTENNLVLAENLHDESPSINMHTLFGEDWQENHDYEDGL
ncbi:MAG: UvrD-helicase domain-containing protein [Halopenitus sp.]